VLAHAALVATLVARLGTVCGPGEHAHALVSMPREQTAQLCHAARAVSHTSGQMHSCLVLFLCSFGSPVFASINRVALFSFLGFWHRCSSRIVRQLHGVCAALACWRAVHHAHETVFRPDMHALYVKFDAREAQLQDRAREAPLLVPGSIGIPGFIPSKASATLQPAVVHGCLLRWSAFQAAPMQRAFRMSPSSVQYHSCAAPAGPCSLAGLQDSVQAQTCDMARRSVAEHMDDIMCISQM